MVWAHGPFADGSGGWHFFLEALWLVVAALALVLLVQWILKLTRGRKDRALRILHERYAKGEINKDQFDRMKADLGG